jgi:hypothetical protein
LIVRRKQVDPTSGNFEVPLLHDVSNNPTLHSPKTSSGLAERVMTVEPI